MNNIPEGFKLVPIEPTEDMVIDGFESVPSQCFTDYKVRDEYQQMSGCQQAAFRAKLCWAAMLAAAPTPPQPIYDEAKELEIFSSHWKLEGRIYRDKNTRQWLPSRDTIEGFQMAERVHALWLGWESCAQSRAKAGEDE